MNEFLDHCRPTRTSTPKNSKGRAASRTSSNGVYNHPAETYVVLVYSDNYLLPYNFITLAGDIFELGPTASNRSESRNSLNLNFDRQPQSRTYTGGSSNFVWPFHKSGSLNASKLPLNEQSVSSLPAGVPTFRVVGRGGSGSKLRQGSLSGSTLRQESLSNSVVVLETESPFLRQPLEHEPSFRRPIGRGGLGSLSTSPPTAMTRKPLKPPLAILDLLRGRKRSEVQLNKQFELHKNSPPRRSQSLYYHPNQITITGTVLLSRGLNGSFLNDLSSNVFADSDQLNDSLSHSGTSGPGAPISQNLHPDHNKDIDSIEEDIFRSTNEHRERSLNKLTRTLGALPPSLMEGSGPSKSPIFDKLNLSTHGDNFIGLGSHQRWDSFDSESDAHSDTHSDTYSPITFAPTFVENSEQTPTTFSDVDSNFTTTSKEDDPQAPAHPAHSSPDSESSSSPMPRLHVSTTSDANDVSPDPNGPVLQSGWLVPLDEVVISIRRTAPSKPQSWTGEWNREMKDVIRDLRRL